MFPCGVCEKSFTRKDALKRHMKTHDEGDMSIPCSSCNQTFTRKDNYRRHLTTSSCTPVLEVSSRKRPMKTPIAAPLTKKVHISLSPVEVAPETENPTLNIPFCNICKISYSGHKIAHLRTTLHKQNTVRHSKKLVESVDYTVEDYKIAFRSRIISYKIKNLDLADLDVTVFFKKINVGLVSLIKQKLLEFDAMKINFELLGRYSLLSKESIEMKSFNTKNEIITKSTVLNDVLQTFYDILQSKMSEFAARDSGWILTEILHLELNMNKYNPMRASTYLPLPKDLEKKKAVINITNNDKECFRWAILAHIHPATNTNKYRVVNYEAFKDELDFTGISFPVKLTDISKFESLNNISVNVYGIKTVRSKSEIIGPFYLTQREREVHVNLLVITDAVKKINHYCLISNLSRLVSYQLSKKEHLKYICNGCLLYFSKKEKLLEHRKNDCNKVVTKLPTAGLVKSKFGKEVPGYQLMFKNFEKSLKIPFVIYFDFESILKPLPITDKEASTIRTNLHEPYSFGYFIKCSYDDSLSTYCTYRGKDAPEIFVKSLETDIKRLYTNYLKHIKPITMTPLDMFVYLTATHCHLCNEPFIPEENDKVKNHDHLTGSFLGAAHSVCNVNYKIPKFIPAFCHNLANYDAHLFIKALASENSKIKCIAQTKEKYITFSKKILVDQTVDSDGQVSSIFMTLRFVDSFRFLSYSIDKLSKTLTSDECINVRKYFPEDLKFDIIRQKGVFPYSYVDGFDKLEDVTLPPPERFCDDLTDKEIETADYERAKLAWNTFNCKTLGEYSDIYLKSDVLLLSDIFENFRSISLRIYDLDPAHFLTAPSLSWDAMLKYTKVKLELLTDINMVHFFRKAIRGGMCQCSKRQAKANNKFLPDEYDPSKPTSYIIYMDVTNLYGAAMSLKLPKNNFQWVDSHEFDENKVRGLSDDADSGYIFEVDLIYPTDLHDKHADLPLCPQNIVPPTGKIPKLCNTLFDKKNYVLHYRNLKQALEFGLILDKIHRVLKFDQSAWLKPYIDKNTEMRNNSKNALEKDFFKLMVNSIFGKTIENKDKRVNVQLVTSWRTKTRTPSAESLIARPNFKSCSIFTEDFVAIQLGIENVIYDKPLYAGFTILDISKIIMYDFFYNFLKRKYQNINLLYTDTDSLIVEIFCENFYSDMKDDLDRFDTSNFSEDNIHGIPVRPSVIGKMKDEYKGSVISEFLGTGAKAYCVDVGGELSKKAKGVKHSVVKNELQLDDYKKAVFVPNTKITRKMKIFRSKLHTIYTERKRLVALSFPDDKRYIMPNCSGETLPWGHKDAPSSSKM